MNENAIQVISVKNKSVEAPQKSMKSFFRNQFVETQGSLLYKREIAMKIKIILGGKKTRRLLKESRQEV